MKIEKYLLQFLPKDEAIKQGIICLFCDKKFYLENYTDKEDLKNGILPHFLEHLTLTKGVEVSNEIIEKLKRKMGK